MDRITVDVGVTLYKQTPTASWSLDLQPVGQPRRRFSLKTSDKHKALAVAREHAAALVAGTWNTSLSGASIKTTVERFLSERCAKRHAEGTKNVTALVFGRFLAWCEGQRIASMDKLNAGHVELYLSDMKSANGWKAPTLNRELAWVRCFARWSMKRGFLRADFTAAVERLPVERRVKFVPSADDLAKIAAECSPTLQDLVWWIANAGGPRIGDTLNVKATDIDLKAETVIYGGQKGRKEYVVKLNAVALAIAKRRLLQAGGGYLFQTGNGTAFIRRNVYRDLRKAAKAAGVQAGNPHALRRAALTLNAAVLTPSQLQQLANHASPSTTANFYIGKLQVTPVPITG